MENYLHKVQYYETDKMGVVHHSNYIRWFEECRVYIMDQFGLGYDKMEEEHIICPVVSVSCKYISMTEFGETVEIRAKIEKFTGIRLIISYEITNKETGTLRCKGESEHCFLNESGMPINLKRSAPEFYELFNNMKSLN